jgi:6-phosphogluconolactonase (cycloisomerase 2 family)
MNMNRLRVLAALAIPVLAAGLGGCVTPAIVSIPFPRFAYVANQNSENLSGYSVDAASGALTTLTSSPYPGVTGPRNVAICPSGQLLYAANGDTSGVSGYQIDLNTGALIPAPGSPFAGGSAPRGVVVDPTGTFVYVANSGDNTISAYVITGANGALTPVAGSPFAAGTGPFGVAVDPTGRFLYAANHKSSNISAYSINSSTGALTEIMGSPFPDQFDETSSTGPFEIALTPNGAFLYVTNHFTNNVFGYSVNASTGALMPLSSAPFRAGSAPFGIQVAPSGAFVYVENRFSANIYVYSLDSTSGALTPIPNSPYSVGALGECNPSPYEGALDGTGRFLFVPDNGCGVISAFSVNASTGELTMLAGSPFPAGNGPYGIAISRLRLE